MSIIITIPKEAAGMRLSDYLNQTGHAHAHPCGGKGTCQKCKVQQIEGCFASVSDPNQTLLPDENGYILSCRAVCRTEGAVISVSSVKGLGLVTEEEALLPSCEDASYAVALDIGTTTLAAALVEQNEKKVIATASALNPQSGYGADVMSRIAACDEGHLEEMQSVLLEAVSHLLQTLRSKADLSPLANLKEMSVAGNPTMLHIFSGVSPVGMGRYPFTPAFLDSKVFSGDALGLACERVTVLPSASAFIGSDVLGGALTEKMLDQEEATLLIDIGTNGEMLLCTGKKRGNALFATSAAAGPALEGANISCGMGGVAGAVCKIEYEVDAVAPVFRTVDDAKPAGLCGSGLVDFAAYLLKSGQLDETGSLEKESVDLIGYHQTEQGRRFTKANVMLKDKDIRALQLAKSAIRAAIETLVDHAGISLCDINATYLAGGLGYYIDKASAVSIGLLPSELLTNAISVGNTALSGAVYCLCHEMGCRQMQNLAGVCQTVELNDTVMFSELFVEHMMFPCDGE